MISRFRMVALAAVASLLACGEDPRTPMPRLSFTYAPAALTAGDRFVIVADVRDVGLFDVVQGESTLARVSGYQPFGVPADFYTYVATSELPIRVRAYGDDGSVFFVEGKPINGSAPPPSAAAGAGGSR